MPVPRCFASPSIHRDSGKSLNMNRSLRCIALLFLFDLFFSFAAPSETWAQLSIPDEKLVGNVYGTVTDASSSRPISGAEIFLLLQPIEKSESGRTIGSNREDFALPDFRSAVRSGRTNERGEFLINFVPTPFPYELYTILIKASGYRLFIIDQARVLPGAVMALRVDCRLSKGKETDAIVFKSGDRNAPMRYRDQERVLPAIPKLPKIPFPKTAAITYTVFATREGLVGASTANGHVILPRDHFVALPSRRALNADDQTYDFQVELTRQGKTVRAPVWDVGPWNTKDDYWNPSAIREMWRDLPEGTPEAQAAFSGGYNGGHDQFGRDVLNPAGIDLAEGTFLDDLGLSDNAWVSVAFLWRPGVAVGQRVQTTATLNVRSTPGGSLVGQVPAGSTGTILAGPQGASYGGYFWIWWEIRWDNGTTRGWSVENWLIPLQKPAAARPLWMLYE